MSSKYTHVIYDGFCGSALAVVNQLCHGQRIMIENGFTLFKRTKPGDNLILHSRESILKSMPFLIYNMIFKRNRIAYVPHCRLRSTVLNKLFAWFVIDYVVCLTKHNQQELDKAGIRNTIYIPNPIPWDKLEKHRQDSYITDYDAVWAGRDVLPKRLSIFLDAIKENNGGYFLVMSPKISEENMDKMEGNFSARRLVAMEGKFNDEFYREIIKARALVFTSDDNEGFPVILLEAMYLGIPIIATDTEKYRMILKDCAVYWKDKEDLARILQLLADGKLELPKATKELIEEYTPDNVFMKYNEW